jgi:hypothetical protein
MSLTIPAKMKTLFHWTLALVICVFALACAYLSVILIMFSSSFGINIDSSEAEVQVAQARAWFPALLGFGGFCVSIVMMILSGRTARFILRVLNLGTAT